MTRRLSRLRSEERGFSLIEVLVVVIIIAVLAAIALPQFTSQRSKANSGNAKANARNLVSQVELCNIQASDYRRCDSADADELGQTNLPYGAGVGQVSVSAAAQKTYTITARSAGDPTITFTVERSGTGPVARSCTPDGPGCEGGGW